MEQIGIIAGGGRLPFIAAGEARAQGLRVVAVAIKEVASPELEAYVDTIHWVGAGELGRLMKVLKRERVSDVVMLGKVPLTLLFSGIRPDLRGALLYLKLKDRQGDSILEGVAEELQREGITLHESPRFLSSVVLQKGILTRRGPNEQEWRDVYFGRGIAKALATLRVGQTVVVKAGTILAVEAAEGTDETIKRGGALGRGGVVVVKVSKPDQDLRFDPPVVGLGTVAALRKANATALALDAGKTLLLDKEEVVKEADAAGMTIVAE